ncbi:hypothetical protein LJC24_00050 [Desulfococcaceae bacterium OttesenSCG-928-F15]|nr:hypothetical protein [Desulfococcaceae bacterium OttesenSCG-928-F15]
MEDLASVKSLTEEAETALVVVGNPMVKDAIIAGTEACGFQVVYADTPEVAFKKLKLHQYHLIVLADEDPLNKPLEKNPIFLFIRSLPMDMRRQIFVLLLSNQYKSQDGLTAFLKSVNMIVNVENIKVFKNLLRKGLAEHNRFYADFMATLQERAV